MDAIIEGWAQKLGHGYKPDVLVFMLSMKLVLLYGETPHGAQLVRQLIDRPDMDLLSRCLPHKQPGPIS